MKAIALLSGGLDSTLAVKLMVEQGIEVVALNFHGPFCTCNHTGCKYVARDLKCEFKSIALGEEYLDIIRSPRHGYGKNLNPCIDCRIFIFRKAKEMLKELGASFVITGEVLGQRPMSQYKQALVLIEKEAGLEGLVLRPLSAGLLPETIPEQRGWVDRSKLLSISGRSRRPQLSLAKNLDIKENFCSGGGCLLTVSSFVGKVKDLIENNCFNLQEAQLLKLGRHFRLNRQLKLIVGRDEKENNTLEAWAKNGSAYLFPEELKGPLGLLRGNFENNGCLNTAASILAHYSDGKREGQEVKIRLVQPSLNINEVMQALPLGLEFVAKLRL